MIARLFSSDGRLLARVIYLAHRFGCAYTSVAGHELDGTYSGLLHFSGPSDALARLSKQIDKLNHAEKETL